MLFAGFTLAVG